MRQARESCKNNVCVNRNVAQKSVRLCAVARKIVMGSTVYLETFGCQMNVADSERADVRLQAAGFDLCQSPESADVVIFNTCSVRERAAHKVFTRIGEIRRQRLGNEPVVGVMGCVAQLEGKTFFDNSPSVNLVVGTPAPDRLPELLKRAVNDERRVLDLEVRATFIRILGLLEASMKTFENGFTCPCKRAAIAYCAQCGAGTPPATTCTRSLQSSRRDGAWQ